MPHETFPQLRAASRHGASAIVPFVALCLLIVGCSAGGNASGSGAPPGGPSVPGSTPAISATSPPAPAASLATSSPAAAVPVLGLSRGSTQGYGSVRPGTLSNGGDPTGIVVNVSWQSWGGPEAVGTGTGYYDPPNVPVSQSVKEQATVVAFDLGTCGGQYMYRGIEWYFPESGGAFNNTTFLNVCSWTFYPGPAPTG